MRILAMVLTMFLTASLQQAAAHDGTTHQTDQTTKAIEGIVGAPAPAPAPGSEAKAREYFTDRPVVTQHGDELRFYSDVLKGRIVVVTLFYTECTGMCPLTNQKLAEVQDLLGDAMGRDFFFVSVSLDAKTDRPDVLKAYAEKFGAKDGWLFLTGEEVDLKLITRRLGQADENIAAHNPYFMLGNVPRAHWTRLRPNMPAEAIATRLRFLSDDDLPTQ
jgi:cytochrome oxidase Cu insertion factor (SCO1/SenC/PrrC family)